MNLACFGRKALFFTTFLAILASVSSDFARAAIMGVEGMVATNVQELIDGDPASVSSDEESGDSSADFPLSAATEVASTDLGGELIAMGRGIGVFEDPTRLDEPNPQEFALETACYSNAVDVTYLVTSETREARTVLFTTPGNPLAEPEIEFRRDGTRQIDSRFFISGAIVIWTLDLDSDDDGLPDQTLDGLEAEVGFTVDHDGVSVPAFDTQLVIKGSGSSLDDSETSGPIVFEYVSLEELGALGVDDETLAILESVAEQGSMTIVVLPQQQHVYRYRVTADESLVLNASITARIRNVPNGSGVAIAIGRPFSELADFIEEAIEGVNGGSIETSLNRLIETRDVGVIVSPRDTGGGLGGAMCGAFGVELYAMLMFVALNVGLMSVRMLPLRMHTLARQAAGRMRTLVSTILMLTVLQSSVCGNDGLRALPTDGVFPITPHDTDEQAREAAQFNPILCARECVPYTDMCQCNQMGLGSLVLGWRGPVLRKDDRTYNLGDLLNVFTTAHVNQSDIYRLSQDQPNWHAFASQLVSDNTLYRSAQRWAFISEDDPNDGFYTWYPDCDCCASHRVVWNEQIGSTRRIEAATPVFLRTAAPLSSAQAIATYKAVERAPLSFLLEADQSRVSHPLVRAEIKNAHIDSRGLNLYYLVDYCVDGACFWIYVHEQLRDAGTRDAYVVTQYYSPSKNVFRVMAGIDYLIPVHNRHDTFVALVVVTSLVYHDGNMTTPATVFRESLSVNRLVAERLAR